MKTSQGILHAIREQEVVHLSDDAVSSVSDDALSDFLAKVFTPPSGRMPFQATLKAAALIFGVAEDEVIAHAAHTYTVIRMGRAWYSFVPRKDV